MVTFGPASLVGEATVQLISTVAPGGRALSLITQGAQCRDKGDALSRYASLSFDIDVELVGTGSDSIAVDVRGGDALTGEHAFGVLRIQVGGEKRTLAGGLDTGEIYGRLVVLVTAPSHLRISALLLTNAGADKAAESLIALDTLDLSFAA